MTYVISGLNGSLEKYKELKKLAKIKDTDTVYAVGGIATGDLELLNELSMEANVYSVMDKNDWRALRMLSGFEKMLGSGGTPDIEYITEMRAWVADGGQSVLDAFMASDADTKEGILDYLGELSMFEEAEIKGKEYLIIGAGLSDYEGEDLYELEPESFIAEPLDMEKKYLDGKIMITARATRSYDKITRVGDNICLDCGCAVCLCLETLKELYA